MEKGKEKLIKEFENRFEEFKKDYGFKSTLEELDEAFHIRDSVKKDGFLSTRLARQVCYRIVENFMGWNDYLHSLIMPNPQNMLNISESKVFNGDEKKGITELMKTAMRISSKNGLNGLKKEKDEEAKFIDESLKIWNKLFKPKLIEVMTKINNEWSKK